MTPKTKSTFSKRLPWLILAALIFLCTLCASLYLAHLHAPARVVATDLSPDTKYHAVLYAYPPLFPAVTTPGDGGGMWDDGFAIVYDTAGNVICQVFVPFAGQGFQKGDIFWDIYRDHKVYIKDSSCLLPQTSSS